VVCGLCRKVMYPVFGDNSTVDILRDRLGVAREEVKDMDATTEGLKERVGGECEERFDIFIG